MTTCDKECLNKAIIVDDSRYSSISIKKTLRYFNFTVIDIAFSVVDFEAFLEGVEKPNIVTMNLVLSDENGIECCEILWKRWPGLPVVFISASPLNDGKKVQLPHVIDFIVKPLTVEKMEIALSKLGS